MNSFQKGARAERAWRDELIAAGFPARRGCQYAGGADSPDVVCPALAPFHFEVKDCERPNPFAFFAQAAGDAGAGKIPVVAMKRKNAPFLVVMHSADFLMLLHAGALAELSGASTMSAANKNARPGDAEASGSGEHPSSIPTAAQLQGQCGIHLQITKLFMQLTEAEARDLLADLRHRHPAMWASVARTESEVAK